MCRIPWRQGDGRWTSLSAADPVGTTSAAVHATRRPLNANGVESTERFYRTNADRLDDLNNNNNNDNNDNSNSSNNVTPRNRRRGGGLHCFPTFLPPPHFPTTPWLDLSIAQPMSLFFFFLRLSTLGGRDEATAVTVGLPRAILFGGPPRFENPPSGRLRRYVTFRRVRNTPGLGSATVPTSA